jgi:2-polyprenyl-3-methyl-5-hydroxy-6-metoxy-1,4-benzoquinol methylase
VIAPCPICNQTSQTIGPIVHNRPHMVAGVPIELGSEPFTMQRCPRCALQFKDPQIPIESLIKCYAQSPSDQWEENPSPRKRRFDDLAKTITDHAVGPRILDVGCSNGALLQYLSQTTSDETDWQCFGLEPGQEARETASQRSVTILGALLNDLDPKIPEHKFDVILAIDVLEHLLEPRQFLDQVTQHLNHGGVFIALTGNSGAPGWKLQAQRYWYCNLPEHQVFYCQQTVEYLADQCGLSLMSYKRLSHMRPKPHRILRDTIRNTLWGTAWRAKGFGISPWRKSLEHSTPPGWLSNRDHMLFVLKAT